MSIKLFDFDGGVRVVFAGWQAEHLAIYGGACSSLLPLSGSGARNLLTAPLTSAIRCLNADGSTTEFCEAFDRFATLRIEPQVGHGSAVVSAGGVYRNARGEPLPVGFRRRTEYQPEGQCE